MSGAVFISDLDGTLLDSAGKLSTYTVDVIHRLNELEFPFIVSTGRNREAAEECLAPVLGLGCLYVTYCNGRYVLLPNGHLETRPGITEEDCAIVASLGSACRVSAFTQDGDYILTSAGGARSLLISALHRGSLKACDRTRLLEFARSDRIDKMRVKSRNLDATLSLLADHLSSSVPFIVDHGDIIEIVDGRSTKRAAVDSTLASLGDFPRHVTVFGDDLNDLDLFNSPYERCAVANAVPEIARLADRVIRSNDEDGVAKEIERILLELEAL